ncbi:MAG TPA: hypothetical protein VJR47_04330 [Stellaceae bacterium]|nr:hypothetical protein [Stellaceae bacterium]
MHRIVTLLRTLGLPLLLAISLSACALGRSTVDIKPPASTASDSKAVAKIVKVEDLRVFEAAPSDAGTPSLQNANEITDKKITARAVARKRNTYGGALGDVVLPESETVADLVRSAAKKALQDKGYAVVEQGSPHYSTALPLSIQIIDFWTWVAPGFWTVNLEFKSTLKLDGDALVGANPPPVTSHFKDNPMAVTDGTWTDMVQRGINDVSDKIRDEIKAPEQKLSGAGM